MISSPGSSPLGERVKVRERKAMMRWPFKQQCNRIPSSAAGLVVAFSDRGRCYHSVVLYMYSRIDVYSATKWANLKNKACVHCTMSVLPIIHSLKKAEMEFSP